MVEEYRHVVIDKNEVGLDTLKHTIASNGLLTADASGYGDQLAPSARNLEHHLHVFMWDSTAAGDKGVTNCLGDGSISFVVRIRWPVLTKDGWLLSGTLQGDNPSATSPPRGLSTNGAWAYKGNIPARYCFFDFPGTSMAKNKAKWESGEGWM